MKSSSAFQKIVRCLRKEGLDLDIQVGDGQIVRFDVPIPGPGGQAEIFITTSEDGIVFIAMLSQRAAEHKREVAELVCRVNRTIRLGRFDLDFKTGEIRFYHCLSASFFRWNAWRRTTEELALVCTTVRDVAPAFVGLLAGLMTPLEAYLSTPNGRGDEMAKAEAEDIASGNIPKQNAEGAVGANTGNAIRSLDTGKIEVERNPAKSAGSEAHGFAPVRDYLLAGLNVRSIIPLAKVETAIRNYLDMRDRGDEATPDRLRMDILLSGPPGTGKTEFVRYLGQKFGLQVVIRTAGDLLDKYVGSTEKAIRAALEYAAEAHAILFLDEFDGILNDRSEARESWQTSHTNEILRCMEDFDGIVIAATNLAERLDPAVIRRFTYKLEFGYLTSEGKEMFFKRAFSSELTEEEKTRLNAIPDLAPGDFKTASQGLYYLGEEVTNELRLDALAREADFKNRNRKAWTASREHRIGFAPPARDARDNKEGNGKP